MKTAAWILLVFVAALAPATDATAQDSETVRLLEVETAKLRAEVARLNLEVLELRERLARLERLLAGHEPMPPEEEVPDPGARPPALAGVNAAGTWVLDTAHIEEVVIRLAKEQLAGQLELAGEQERAFLLEMITRESKKQVAKMDVTAVLNPDGTFTITGSMADDRLDFAGTWEQTGNRVTITTTHEDGELQDEPEIKSAFVEGDSLTFPEDDSRPFDLKLVRR